LKVNTKDKNMAMVELSKKYTKSPSIKFSKMGGTYIMQANNSFFKKNEIDNSQKLFVSLFFDKELNKVGFKFKDIDEGYSKVSVDRSGRGTVCINRFISQFGIDIESISGTYTDIQIEDGLFVIDTTKKGSLQSCLG
jgi:hypothetical protein